MHGVDTVYILLSESTRSSDRSPHCVDQRAPLPLTPRAPRGLRGCRGCLEPKAGRDRRASLGPRGHPSRYRGPGRSGVPRAPSWTPWIRSSRCFKSCNMRPSLEHSTCCFVSSCIHVLTSHSRLHTGCCYSKSNARPHSLHVTGP